MFRSALTAPLRAARVSAASTLPRVAPAAPVAQRFASSSSSAKKEMTVRDAINSAMEEEMIRDDSVFVLGEEVARCEWRLPDSWEMGGGTHKG